MSSLVWLSHPPGSAPASLFRFLFRISSDFSALVLLNCLDKSKRALFPLSPNLCPVPFCLEPVPPSPPCPLLPAFRSSLMAPCRHPLLQEPAGDWGMPSFSSHPHQSTHSLPCVSPHRGSRWKVLTRVPLLCDPSSCLQDLRRGVIDDSGTRPGLEAVG